MRPYLRAANVGWDGLKLDDVKSMNFTDDELAVYRLQAGDIVLAEASGSAGEVGKPAIWRDEIADCCIQNTLIRVRSWGVEPAYLLHFLRAEARRGAFVEKSRGVGIHHIGAGRLAEWRVPVPPLSEQAAIAESIDEIHVAADRLASAIRSAHQRQALLRRSLMADAFSGRLVAQNPTDEPASVLLERIRADRATRQPARRRKPAPKRETDS